MKNKTFLTTLMLVGLIVLGSNAFGQFQTNTGSSSAATEQIQTSVPNMKLLDGAVDLKVPINLTNNTGKVYWYSPNQIPATIIASLINNGKTFLDITAVSLNSTTKKQEWNYLGRAMPGGDGIIIFGKYIQLWINSPNWTTKQYGIGTLEVVTWVPQ